MIFNSIAALQGNLTTPQPNELCQVLGYWAPGDGGGGDFIWNASATTDDGGTIIKQNNIATGRWKRKYSGPVNIRWFGARGTGMVDDSSYIQPALAFSHIFIPAGKYLVSTTLVCDLPLLHIDGEDSHLSRFFSAVSNSPVLKFTGTNLTLRDLDFSKSKDLGSNASAIEHFATDVIPQIQLSNCSFNYFDNDAIIIKDVVYMLVDACSGSGPYEDIISTPTTSRVASFINIDSTTLGYSTTITFNKCNVNKYKHAIKGVNCNNLVIKDCVFELNWIAIYIRREPTYPNGAFCAGIFIDENWFERNLHPNYGGGYFKDLDDSGNVDKFCNNVYVGDGNHYWGVTGRDQLDVPARIRHIIESNAGRLLITNKNPNGNLPVIHTSGVCPDYNNVPIWENFVADRPAADSSRGEIRNSVLDGANKRWWSRFLTAGNTLNITSRNITDNTDQGGRVNINQFCVNNGPTASRPFTSSLLAGLLYYDTTLSKLIVWNGSSWKDCMGNNA